MTDTPLRQALSEQLQQVQQIANQSMAYASDLGIAIRFLEENYDCHECRHLVDHLASTLAAFDLRATIQIQDGYGSEVIASPHCTHTQRQWLQLGRKQQRIWSEGALTVFSYPYCGILIEDMPVANEYRIGILRDTVATIANGASSRARALLREVELRGKQTALLAVLDQTLRSINTHCESLSMQADKTIESMVANIREIISEMNAIKGQEQSILDVMRLCSEQHRRMAQKNVELDGYFTSITELVNHISESSQSHPVWNMAEKNAGAAGVELF
jgi:hypothetical protein